jgi:RNA polymerase sigma-70 factor, ECF subfamily
MNEQAEIDIDRELLVHAHAGDMSAFEQLVERHRDRVFSVALRITRSEADAAEITQDTFLSAYEHLGEFRGEAAFGSWVHRIAANLALMRVRHQNVVEAAGGEPNGPEFDERGSLAEYPASDWSRRADEQALDAEMGMAIEEATGRLPEAYRQVFVLKDVEGLSYEDISKITGNSIPAIKSRLHRARLALREAIDRFYNEQ